MLPNREVPARRLELIGLGRQYFIFHLPPLMGSDDQLTNNPQLALWATDTSPASLAD